MLLDAHASTQRDASGVCGAQEVAVHWAWTA